MTSKSYPALDAEELARQLAAERAVVAELVEALEPFAEMLGYEDPIGVDDKVTVQSGPTIDHTIKGADILRLRAALAKIEGRL
jgi:hypothetical protein